jgi:hypothetical protein
MANIVIVSARCYLLAEAINWITIDEVDIEHEAKDEYRASLRKSRSKKKKASIKKAPVTVADNKDYFITISFIPVGSPASSNNALKSSSSGGYTSVGFTVNGHKNALALYSDIVNQIREQLPDQLYLDKLVEKFLQGDNT